jgi:DNA-formamidopyrimidine glycosylase
MPESPEASYLAKIINKDLKGKTLNSVKILKGRYKKHGEPTNFKKLVDNLPLKFEKIEKKGKVLFFYFEKGWCIISKLGLTGWWYINDNAPKWKPDYKNIEFSFSNNTQLTYTDTLSYGTITILNTDTDIHDKDILQKELDDIAMDIVDSSTTWPKFWSHVQEKMPKIKNKYIEEILMDQHLIVSGIGNYLKSEVLYDSKISPLRKVKDISEDEWRDIFNSMKKLAKRMYNALIIEEQGKEGYYDSRFAVYQKEKDPYGNEIKKHKTKTGRTTFWVPSLQK